MQRPIGTPELPASHTAITAPASYVSFRLKSFRDATGEGAQILLRGTTFEKQRIHGHLPLTLGLDFCRPLRGLTLFLATDPGFRFARSREKININVRVSGRERHLV